MWDLSTRALRNLKKLWYWERTIDTSTGLLLLSFVFKGNISLPLPHLQLYISLYFPFLNLATTSTGKERKLWWQNVGYSKLGTLWARNIPSDTEITPALLGAGSRTAGLATCPSSETSTPRNLWWCGPGQRPSWLPPFSPVCLADWEWECCCSCYHICPG